MACLAFWCQQVEAWVVRFARECGLGQLGTASSPWDVGTNVHVCPATCGPRGKGPIAMDLGITHFVDNTGDCLWSVLADPAGNAGDTIEAPGPRTCEPLHMPPAQLGL